MKDKLKGAVRGFRARFQSRMDNRAQSGGMASLFIGLMVAAIVAFNVFIPVIQDAAANLTGTTATIANLLPLFAALLVLIGLASPLMRRT